MDELYAGQGWPPDGDELLQRSLGPRSPDMLLEAPGAGPAGMCARACGGRGAGDGPAHPDELREAQEREQGEDQPDGNA